MFSEASYSLMHPTLAPPPESIARGVLNQLAHDGYKIVLNPRAHSEVVEEFAWEMFSPPLTAEGRYQQRIKEEYREWREADLNMHLFTMSNNVGRLAVASWIKPMPHEATEAGVEQSALAELKLVDVADHDLGNFILATLDCSYRKIPIAKSGVLIQATELRVDRACRELGYVSSRASWTGSSGNTVSNMIVSSESLHELGVTREPILRPEQPKPAPVSEPPKRRRHLRIIKDQKNDQGD